MKAAAVTVCLFWLLLLLIVSTPASSQPTFLFPNAEATDCSWTSKEPMHEARSSLGVAVVNGKIYAIGGSTRRGSSPYVGGVVGTNEEYDPVTDAWTFKKPMPTPRAVFAIAVYRGKIYCIGGRASSGYIGVSEVYDPATDTWETKTPMPTARAELCAHVVGDKIYLIGGLVPSNSPGVNASLLNEVYDPETDTWTTRKPMPTVANVRASAVVDGKIYVIGRLSEDWDSTLNYIYDPETDTWSQGAPLPAGTMHAEAGATTGVNAPKRIYVLGQNVSDPLSAPYITGVYNPKHDSWAFGAPIPTKRIYFGVAVVNDMLYAIGGMTITYTEPLNWFSELITPHATNEQYTPFGYGTVPPKISEPIYIRSDGSVDPVAAPIQRDGNVYTFLDNINGSIFVEKDNVVVDGGGYTLRGDGGVAGIRLENRRNVTIKNMQITHFGNGIELMGNGSQNNTIIGNNITDNGLETYGNGIWLTFGASNNTIYGNNIKGNWEGIYIYMSSGNIVSENYIIANRWDGVWICAVNNSIIRNDIINNGGGVLVEIGSNTVHHNNFVNNTVQAVIGEAPPVVSIWDDGKEGNYWSDYEEKYPHAKELDSSGIWDTPYVIYENNQDNYPLMTPYGIIPPSDATQPFPTTWIAAAIAIVLGGAAITLGAAVYRRKRLASSKTP